MHCVDKSSYIEEIILPNIIDDGFKLFIPPPTWQPPKMAHLDQFQVKKCFRYCIVGSYRPKDIRLISSITKAVSGSNICDTRCKFLGICEIVRRFTDRSLSEKYVTMILAANKKKYASKNYPE